MAANDKAPLGDGALPELITAVAGNANAVTAAQYTTFATKGRWPRRASAATPASVATSPLVPQVPRHVRSALAAGCSPWGCGTWRTRQPQPACWCTQ